MDNTERTKARADYQHAVRNPEEFRKRWPGIASIACVADLLEELQREREEWFVRVTELLLLLRDFLDMHEGPCRLDHEGFCQEHSSSAPCLVARARRLFSEAP